MTVAAVEAAGDRDARGGAAPDRVVADTPVVLFGFLDGHLLGPYR
ncbi:hypothetical protein [Streptomyces sp. KL116D]